MGRLIFLLVSMLLVARLQAQEAFPAWKWGTFRYKGAIPFRAGDLWGLSDARGRMIVPPEYPEMVYLAPDLIAGYLRKGISHEYALFGKRGQLLRRITSVESNPFVTSRVLQYATYFRPLDEREDIRWQEHYHREWQSTHCKRFLFDHSGKLIGDTTGYNANLRVYGRFIVAGQATPKQRRYGLLDTFGKVLTPVQYSEIFPFRNEVLLIREQSGILLAGTFQGAEHPLPFTSLDTIETYFPWGYFVLKESKVQGPTLVRFDGKVLHTAPKGAVFEPEYKADSGHYFYIRQPGRNAAAEPAVTLLDSAGASVLPRGYAAMPYLGRCNFPVFDLAARKTVLYNVRSGSFIRLKRAYESIGVYNEHLRGAYLHARSSDTTYVLDSLGRELFSFLRWSGPELAGSVWFYAQIGMPDFVRAAAADTFHCLVGNNLPGLWPKRLYEVRINGQCGIFDPAVWRLVVPAQYREISGLGNGILALTDSSSHLYNLSGKRLLTGYVSHQVLQTCGAFLLVSVRRQPAIMDAATGRKWGFPPEVVVADTAGRIWRKYPDSEANRLILMEGGWLLAVKEIGTEDSDEYKTQFWHMATGKKKRVNGSIEPDRCDPLFTVPDERDYHYYAIWNKGLRGLFDYRALSVALPPVFEPNSDFYYQPSLIPGLFTAHYNGKFLGYFDASGRKYWKD